MPVRAFVVGNGSSLNETNLDLLQGEVSFAVNGISAIYPKTLWHPTYYVRAEEAATAAPEFYTEDILLHVRELKCETWANTWFLKALEGERIGKEPNFHALNACPHYATHFDCKDAPHLWHMPLLCTFGSSVHVAIQIAVNLGYSPIYLLGCDVDYEDEKPNHFHPVYERGAGKLREARYTNMDLIAAHMVAARSSPVPIFNAGVGGRLEVYERVKYERLFS